MQEPIRNGLAGLQPRKREITNPGRLMPFRLAARAHKIPIRLLKGCNLKPEHGFSIAFEVHLRE
jgi:hypothetical protein